MFILPCSAFCATGVIDSAYSYDYTQPPEFQPSMNSQFTALSSGVTDIFANPAGIMHVNTIEVAIGVSGYVQNPVGNDQNKIYVDDTSMGGIQGSPNSRAYVRLTDDRASITAESRPVTIDENYSKGGGVNYFGMTYKVSDWLAFSVSRMRPTAISFNYQALVPIMLDAQADFRGTSVEVGGAGDYINVRNDGSIEVVVSGVPFTSEVSAWSGFLRQGTSEVNWMNGEFDNSIMNQNSIVLSAAAKTGAFTWGLNIIPMTVDMRLNNEVSIRSDSNNNDLVFYMPKFDFESSEEAINWVTRECGTANGYHSMSVETMAGEKIGEARIAGNYSGSLTRMDFGMQWEPNDFFSAGAVYENFNGATLKMEGVNVVQEVYHWVDTNSQMPIGSTESYWNPFLSSPTHEVETERIIRNTLTMQPIELPKNLKFGFAFKKPFLIAVDWEQWQNEYKYSSDPGHPETAHYINLKDITFLKIGMEVPLFFLFSRGNITGLVRASSDDRETQKNIEDIFANTPAVPVDGNLYLGARINDSEIGLGFGGGGLPFIKALMLDMTSIAKVFYTNLYYKKGDWQISYLYTLDPVLTGFSSEISSTKGVSSDIKLMSTSTLSIGFRF
jgi:hypothetical protein